MSLPYELGQTVKFTGYTAEDDSEKPENHTLLTEGEEYEIREISDEDGNDPSFFLAAPNPDFNDQKRESKKANPRYKLVDVFTDEIGEAEITEETPLDVAEVDDEAPVAEAAPKKTTKKKATSKKTTKKTAKKKTKAKAKAAAEVPVIEYNEDNDIVLTDAMQADEVLALIEGKTPAQMIKVAQTHARDAMLKDWVLGGILYNVKTSGAYKKVHDKKYDQKKGWEMFVDEQIGLDYRKAQYLIDIYAKFNRLGVSAQVAARLGWSKASRISAVMTHENKDELVELADDSSFRDLDDTIKTEYRTKGATKGTKIKKIGFRFRIAEEGGAIIADYLEQARQELGLDSLDDTFQHVITEWSQEHLNLKARSTKNKGKKRGKAAAATGNGKTAATQEATA